MAITRRSSGEIFYPILSAGAFTATLAVRETGPAGAPKPRLLDRVREAIRARHYSRRTEKAYVHFQRLVDDRGQVSQSNISRGLPPWRYPARSDFTL